LENPEGSEYGAEPCQRENGNTQDELRFDDGSEDESDVNDDVSVMKSDEEFGDKETWRVAQEELNENKSNP
jgi:hypothetical protein